MANSFAGIAATGISTKGLANLKRKIGPITRYCTDFSSEFMAPGQSAVTTRLFSSAPAARTFTTSDTGYTRDDTTSTAVTVTPNILYSQLDINELELSGSPVDLENKLGELAAEAVAKGIFDRINALVLAANYSSSVTASVANFGLDDMISARSTLVAAGVALDTMHTCVSAGAFASVLSSTATYPQIQRDPNGTGNVVAFPGVGDIYEISSVAANAENLYGWSAGADAFAIVARQPMAPTNWYGDVSTVTDPESGLSMQTRVSFSNGVYTIWTGALVGVAKGRGTSLVRYITA